MTDSLFLFINSASLDLENATSLVIDSKGKVIHSYQVRSLLEIQKLHQKHSLIVILQSTVINAHRVHLPTLKNAALMLPNIIEESLVQNIENMHFVFNKTPLRDKCYLAYSVIQTQLETVIEQLKKASLTAASITTDLLPALKNTLLVGEHYLQFISETQCGALRVETLPELSKTFFEHKEIMLFSNSTAAFTPPAFSKAPIKHKESYQAFIAKELHQKPGLNLLQGPYKIRNKQSTLKHFSSALLVMFSLFFFMGAHINDYYKTSHRLALLKKENLSLYKKIFPEASSIISPHYRIEAWLKENASQAEQPFFTLLQKSSKALYSQKELSLLSIAFQNKILTLTFILDNFESLNQLQKKFELESITVNQLSAITEHNKVNAVWEISL